MPVYEFFCKCGKRVDRLVPVDERDTQVCTCGEIMERKISVPGAAIYRYKERDRLLNQYGPVPDFKKKAF